MAQINANGIQLAYEFADREANRPTVLFIHGGYGGPATTLMPADPPAIVAALRGVARTITYDRRSAGQSEYVTAHYTMADIVADAIGLLDSLDIDRAIVCGSSAGGPIAIQLALDAPHRVQALALPNTGAALMSTEPSGVALPYSEDVRDRFARVRHFLDQVDGARSTGDEAYFATRVDEIREAAFPPGSTPNRGFRKRLRRAFAASTDADLFRLYIGMLRNYEAYEDLDLTSELHRLNLPTWSVHGTNDRAVPFEYGESLARHIDGLEFETIEGAGHGILGNEQAQRLLADWVRRVGKA